MSGTTSSNNSSGTLNSSANVSTSTSSGSKSIEIAFNPKEFEPLTGQRGVLKAFAASFVEAQKAFKSDATQVSQLLEAAEQAAQTLYLQQHSAERGVTTSLFHSNQHEHTNGNETARQSQPIISLVFEPNENKATDLGRSSCLIFAPTFVNLFGTTISDWDFLLRRITGIASADQGIKMLPRHLHESVSNPLVSLLCLSRDLTLSAAPILLSCSTAAVHIPFPLPPSFSDVIIIGTGGTQTDKRQGKNQIGNAQSK